MKLNEILGKITPLNSKAMEQASKLQNDLVKPSGSLGELEKISVKIAGITGKTKNRLSKKVIYLFGSDHGIYEEGVCSSPQDFTAKLMKIYAEKQNAGINILSRQAGAELKIFDLGVKNLSPQKNIITKKFLQNGTNNFLHGRAMSLETAKEVIKFGISVVRDAKDSGVDIIGTGEVGMANTSSACACIMAALKSSDENFVGRGAGLDDESFARKKRVILDALKFHEENLTDPVNIISCVGGLDIAAMTGIFIGGALYKIPVIIDGVISISAALLAYQLENLIGEYFFASHESLEPAFKHAADFMKLTPPLKLSMRLGEGTGCAVFMQIIDDSLAIINEMGTFEDLQMKGEILNMEILVVDCQYDFIDGSLACGHSEEAVKNIIALINENPDAKVYYSADNHGENNCSYIQNGGTWPVHCKAGTHGAEIHASFKADVKNPSQRPNDDTVYYKGVRDDVEEYSAFNAKNKFGKVLNQVIGHEVLVCGIASEFCVRESVLELMKSGRKIEVRENLLGWVDENNHRKNLDELSKLGVKIS